MKKLKLAPALLFLALLIICHPALAQPSLKELLATPYVSSLTSHPEHSSVFFVVNEKGARNIYQVNTAFGDEAQRVTDFPDDDGLEITSLTVSPNGEWISFVRGGEHGGNSAVRPINPASSVFRQQILLYGLHLPTKKLYNFSEGDYPVFHPSSESIIFLRNGQAWSVSLNDPDKAAAQLFYTSGNVNSLQWSPNGQKLLFVASRGGHSFIGVYEAANPRIHWVSPSFHRDRSPQWSPDGTAVTFVRTPASGGAIDSILMPRHQPWAIMTASLDGGEAKEVWSAPQTIRGSVPPWQGSFNLRWNQPNKITFLSYQDGWPHLYLISPDGTGLTQLTKGNYTVDQFSYSSDGRYIAFAANHGPEREDIDRKHIGLIDLGTLQSRMLTAGEGIEAYPVFLNSNNTLAYLSSTLHRAFLPAVVSLSAADQPARILGEELMSTVDLGSPVMPAQVTFQSEDGLLLHGQLFRPENLQEPAPALVYVHGGPRRQMFLGWHFLDYYFYDYIVNQYLASKGFVVLAINYRMGTGYGFDFQSPANAGTQGASEYLDILASGKWLMELPEVDNDRVGVFGGSYGGYLTAMALGRNSEIFKAGVDVHGVHNRSRRPVLGENAPDFDLASQLAWESSPSRWVDGWTSPVLLIHSDDDQNVAFSQSIDLYNRLQKKGVETEILVIPDDTHHWMVFSNLVRVKEAAVRFLEKNFLN